MIRRLQDWPSALFAYVEDRRNEPFQWGRMDCCMFAAGAIEAMTGVDATASFPAYEDEFDAKAILAAHEGLESLVEVQCQKLGFTELPTPRKAQRGDLVLFDNAGNPAIGICIGGEVAFPGKAGVVFHPLRDCRRAWRVG